MQRKTRKVLVVKRDRKKGNELAQHLRSAGYSVKVANTFNEARNSMAETKSAFYAAMVDLELPDGNIREFIASSGFVSFCHVIAYDGPCQTPHVQPGLGMVMNDDTSKSLDILERMGRQLQDSAGIRTTTISDVPAVYEIANQTWSKKENVVLTHFLQRQFIFGEGQFVATATINGLKRVIGFIGALIVRGNMIKRTWIEFTGNGTYSTHEPTGDTLACPQIGTDREFLLRMEMTGIAKKLILAEQELARQMGLGLIAYSRFSGFEYQRKMSPLQTPGEYYEYCIKTGFREEQNIGMHLHFGGQTKSEWILPNACPMDSDAGGAIVIVQYPTPWLEKPVTIQLLSEERHSYQFVPM